MLCRMYLLRHPDMVHIPYFLAGALVGFIVGMTGNGGGALMTPLLILFFKIPTPNAIATALWLAASTKLVALQVYQKQGQVDWPVAARLWLGSLPIALLTTLKIYTHPTTIKVAYLTKAVGGIVLCTAIGMLFSSKLVALAKKKSSAAQVSGPLQTSATILAGALLGVLVALTSVGAGTLGTVLLTLLYPIRMTPKRLVATDIAHAIPLATVSGIGYVVAGQLDHYLFVHLLAGALPGAIGGGLLAQHLPGRLLKRYVAFVLIGLALQMLL